MRRRRRRARKKGRRLGESVEAGKRESLLSPPSLMWVLSRQAKLQKATEKQKGWSEVVIRGDALLSGDDLEEGSSSPAPGSAAAQLLQQVHSQLREVQE